MGYLDVADIPSLPTTISLDNEKVSEVLESMREVLTEMGRTPPTVESAIEDKEEHSDARVKAKLDAADALLRKLNHSD